MKGTAVRSESEEGRPTERFIQLGILVFLGLLCWLSQNHIFFWDTVQFAGKHGLWFYQNEFESLLLPPEIDSGHPPGFGWYIASIWLIFGKSLAVSHWAMFPFLLGIAWQSFLLAKRVLHHISPYWFVLLLFADPVLLSQSVLVSPDIALVFFFLVSLNGLLYKRSFWKAIGYLGLAFISLRGMMLVAALGFFDLQWHWSGLLQYTWRKRLQWFSAYLPAAVFSVLFLFVHYRQYAWIGYHAESPWAPSFVRVDLQGFLRNIVILTWRWLDFGRIVVWGLLLLFLCRKKRIIRHIFSNSYWQSVKNKPAGQVLLLLLMVTLALSISFLSYVGLQAHRYLLPAFLLLTLLSMIIADQWVGKRFRKVILTTMVIGLLTGNLWVYPDRIAQGWDSSLAHWPYYHLRQNMLDFIAEEEIELTAIGTAFPSIGPLRFQDLSDRELGFTQKDFKKNQWILYSNVMNDFTDEELTILNENWVEVKRFESQRVKIILYHRTGLETDRSMRH